MTSNEFFHAGRLKDAVDAQIQKIKNAPADKAARLFLVELLLFQGDLDRAKKHLDLLNYDSPEAQAGLELYRRAWDAEVERRQVLAGKSHPFGLIDSPEHISLRLQALEQFSQGNTAAGNALVDQANASMPAAPFIVDGQQVLSLRDSDDLLSGVLEVFSRGRYCWMPWEHVEKLQLAEPKSPREVLYVPAHLTVRGTEGDVLIPGLYADSYLQVDEDIRLGRATDWLGLDDAPLRGVGGKVLYLEDQTKPLLHVREIISPTAAAAASDEG
jgi:type VI secretion system protein ImpE